MDLIDLLIKMNTPIENNESEHECTNFAFDNGDYYCTECFAVQIKYLLPSELFMNFKSQEENQARRLFFNRYLKFEDKYKLSSSYGKLDDDYLLFKDTFNSVNLGLDSRKYLIPFELIMCFLLRKRGVNCYIHQFDELRELHFFLQNRNLKKLSALAFCWQVLKRLGWDQYFYLCNKDTMDELKLKIEQFVEGLGKEQYNAEMIVSVERALAPYYMGDVGTVESQCAYQFKRGSSKGQTCGRKCKSSFCYEHSKRVLKEIEFDNKD